VLRPPLEVALERATGRGEGLLSAAVVEQLWRSFSELGELEHHVLDNAGQTPEETATEVAAGL
jgi:hypothetical protein